MTENKGDLISREALKKAIEPYRYATDGIFEGISLIIDNAPTVEGEILTEEAYSDLCLRASKLRPKGEWNYIQAGMCVCPFCGAMPHKEYKNFCAKCGADMRGKDNGKNL